METIKLNDVEYVKKEDFDKLQTTLTNVKPKVCCRFDSSTEQNALKALNTFFSGYGKESISEDLSIEKGAVVIDPANVMCCIGKTERAKRVLARYIDSDTELKAIPELKFEATGQVHGKYSMEYFSKMTNFFKIIKSDAVKVSMGLNHPIQIEDEDFALILAPRVEADE